MPVSSSAGFIFRSRSRLHQRPEPCQDRRSLRRSGEVVLLAGILAIVVQLLDTIAVENVVIRIFDDAAHVAARQRRLAISRSAGQRKQRQLYWFRGETRGVGACPESRQRPTWERRRGGDARQVHD